MKQTWWDYKKRCDETGQPCLILPEGTIGKIGNHRYAENGIVYVNRKRVGPYLVSVRFGGCEMVVKFAEQKNIHRFETHRWTILHHLKELLAKRKEVIAELKKPRREVVGLYRNQWYRISIKNGGIDTKQFDINKDEILDQLVVCSRNEEEHRSVARYLLNEARLGNCWERLGKIDSVLHQLFRELNPERGTWAVRGTVSFLVNGRTYVSHDGYASSNASANWPSPLTPHIDLDAGARYE